MVNQRRRSILVGDNPFHGVSHVSRGRALQRDGEIANTAFAAELVMTAVRNGATGFTFTVSDTTLAMVERIGGEGVEIEYYPLVPNIAEMIRTAGRTGGIPGLAREMGKRVVSGMRATVPLNLLRGIILNDPESLFNSYLTYEYMRLERAMRKGAGGWPKSVLLHEVVTDIALALDMEWLFRTHIALMQKLGPKPGFETRNLPYLAAQFRKWKIDPEGIVIEAPFNAVGFQMCPSREDCERALRYLQKAEVVAFSIMAGGYLKPPQALDYISTLNGLSGIAVGVSSEKQAVSTFSLARRSLG